MRNESIWKSIHNRIVNVINIESLIVAVVCCVPMFSFICNIDNIIPLSFLSVMIFTFLYERKKIDWSIVLKNNVLVIGYFVLLSFFLSINIFFGGFNYEGFKRGLYFSVYAVLPIIILFIVYISKNKLDIIKMFKYINIIYAIFAMFIYNDNFYTYPYAERMPLSYYILPVFLSTFLTIILEKKSNKKAIVIRVIIYMCVYFPYLRFLFGFMSRGAVLAIFFCIACVFVLWLRDKKGSSVIAFLAGFTCFFIVIVLFGTDILKAIHNILDTFNLQIGFVEKNIRLLQSHSLGNGRGIIYKNAIEGFLNSPFLGNGIGSFQNTYNTYPHNFILQMLYECGLFYTFFLCIPIFYCFFYVFKDNNGITEYKCFYLFVFSVSIVRLSLSFEYWLDSFFWICVLISLILLSEKYKKRGEI